MERPRNQFLFFSLDVEGQWRSFDMERLPADVLFLIAERLASKDAACFAVALGRLGRRLLSARIRALPGNLAP